MLVILLTLKLYCCQVKGRICNHLWKRHLIHKNQDRWTDRQIKGGGGNRWKNIQQVKRIFQYYGQIWEHEILQCSASNSSIFLSLSYFFTLSRFTRRVTGSSLLQFRPQVVQESSMFLSAFQRAWESSSPYQTHVQFVVIHLFQFVYSSVKNKIAFS